MKHVDLHSLRDRQEINLVIKVLNEERYLAEQSILGGNISDGTVDSLVSNYHYHIGYIEGLKFLEVYLKSLEKDEDEEHE